MYDNASKWFGVNNKTTYREVQLADVIEGTIDLLMTADEFQNNPLPNSNPLVLINSTFIENLFNKGISTTFGKLDNKVTNDEFEFVPLAADRWEKLRQVGLLKQVPITFQSGTADLDLMGEGELEKAVSNLKHYPKFRVYVKGHTGLRGDSKANKRIESDQKDLVLINR
jgi:hypothetical protein